MIHTTDIHESNVRYLFASARYSDVSCIMHLHTTAEIVLVTDGELEVTVGNKTYQVPKGCGIYITPYEPHGFASPKKNTSHVLMFSPVLISYLRELTAGRIPTSHIFAVSGAAMLLQDEILPGVQNEVDSVSAQAVLAPLCHDIMKHCIFEQKSILSYPPLEGALQYMNTHFTEDISLADVANAIAQHPVTLSKMFSKKTSIGFTQHLRYLRCEFAADQIRQGQKTMTEIAFSSGFGSVRSFNRAFMEVYGFTPSEYKQKKFLF